MYTIYLKYIIFNKLIITLDYLVDATLSYYDIILQT